MPLFHHLRTLALAFLGRAVLAWFALSLGVAVASPLVDPQGLELVCSSTGVMKVVARQDGGAPAASAAHLDCPMCMPRAAPPPPAPAGALPPPSALSHVLRPIAAARLAAATAAPPPARGPPRL